MLIIEYLQHFQIYRGIFLDLEVKLLLSWPEDKHCNTGILSCYVLLLLKTEHEVFYDVNPVGTELELTVLHILVNNSHDSRLLLLSV